MRCMICLKDEVMGSFKSLTRHINLYVIGSEGLVVCHSCEMEIVEHIREKRRKHGIKRKEDIKKKKRENKRSPLPYSQLSLLIRRDKDD